MEKVKLENVTKVYDGGNVAVKKVNLTIKDKEFVVLVGPSGCGKSTTLRMIAGLEEITEGELFIEGKLVNDVSPKYQDNFASRCNGTSRTRQSNDILFGFGKDSLF